MIWMDLKKRLRVFREPIFTNRGRIKSLNKQPGTIELKKDILNTHPSFQNEAVWRIFQSAFIVSLRVVMCE
jgi:hypothetical protein